MRYPLVVHLLALLLLPGVAHANSMAPIFPVVSMTGWIALPLIVLVEGLFHSRRSLPHPFRLSFYSNLWSALVGLLPAVATFPLMLGPAIDPYLDIMLVGGVLTVVGLLFHWWLSSHLEHWFCSRHRLWKDEHIPLSHFYRVNGLSYNLIALWFLIMLVRLLIEYSTKT